MDEDLEQRMAQMVSMLTPEEYERLGGPGGRARGCRAVPGGARRAEGKRGLRAGSRGPGPRRGANV
jgi:hypothetical protein